MATETAHKPRKGSWVGTGIPGPGRKKGVPNRVTVELRDMILTALDRQGGWKYLQRQADENPAAFMALLGRILPRQIEGQLEGDVVIRVMTGVPRPKVDEVAES